MRTNDEVRGDKAKENDRGGPKGSKILTTPPTLSSGGSHNLADESKSQFQMLPIAYRLRR
jgi:hypothetical protein